MSSPRIVLIDLEPALMAEVLHLEFAADVEYFTNGLKAWDRLRTAPPDIVVLDVHMLHVPELLVEMSADMRWCHVPKIVVTADIRLIAQGRIPADKVFAKPFNVAEFLTTMRRYLPA